MRKRRHERARAGQAIGNEHRRELIDTAEPNTAASSATAGGQLRNISNLGQLKRARAQSTAPFCARHSAPRSRGGRPSPPDHSSCSAPSARAHCFQRQEHGHLPCSACFAIISGAVEQALPGSARACTRRSPAAALAQPQHWSRAVRSALQACTGQGQSWGPRGRGHARSRRAASS